MMKIVILFVLVATAAAAPSSLLNKLSLASRIVGGENATIEQVPYQVSIEVNGTSICGGSIIAENWILTAAHCMVYDIAWYIIRAGSSLASSGGSVSTFDSYITHENYSVNSDYGYTVNDIALIHLNDNLTLDSTRAIIPLYEQGEEAVEGAKAIVSGWGSLTESGYWQSVLQVVTLPIISKSDCNTSYIAWGGLPYGEICAGYSDGGHDACTGDSGGPLAIDGVLAGIVTWGKGCAEAGWPGVYTEVAYYRDWISEKSGV
ncbi:trypsin-1-like [Neodiprion fabricii]|uniref:trypsin-1-like n=1 Tax=Neodiprion fabricii TaxID=2872261 RepID=UPI001ED971E9|nr:trypsin-1-like [Neodiprion fabricii]